MPTKHCIYFSIYSSIGLFTIALLLCSSSVGILQAQITLPQYYYGAERSVYALAELQTALIQEAKYRATTALAAFPASSAQDRLVLSLAEAEFRAGEYESAYRRINTFTAERPNSPLIAAMHMLAGERAFEQQRYAQAHEYFFHAARQAQTDIAQRVAEPSTRDSSNPKPSAYQAYQPSFNSADAAYSTLAANALFWDGVSLLVQSKHERDASAETAQARLIFCANTYPDGDYADDALFLCGRLATVRGEYEQALTYYNRLIKTYPNRNTRLAASLRVAQNYIALRQTNDALVALDNIREQMDKNLWTSTQWMMDTEKKHTTNAANRFPTSVPVPSVRASAMATHSSIQSYADNAEEHWLYLRGEALNLSGKYDEANSTFSTLINSYPQSPMVLRARLGKGFALLNRERYDDALKQYDAIIDADLNANATNTQNNDDVRLVSAARLYRPVCLKQSGRRDEARKELSALAIRSDFAYTAQALVELGQMQYEEGKFDEARKTLERALRENPEPMTSVRAQMLLGETCVQAGFYSVALRAFDKTEQLAEQTPSRLLPNKSLYVLNARLKRGVAMVGAKQSREAIATLGKFLAQFPDAEGRDEAAFWLAEAYYEAELLTNAETAFQTFLKTYPQSHRVEAAWYGLGWTQFRTRQFTEAAGTFTRMLREFPQSEYALDVLTRKGDGHYLTKQYRPAADAYRQASRMKPKSAQGEYAAFQLGQCLYRLQDFDQAASEMENFVKRYPNSTLADEAAYLLGWMYFQQRRYDDAATQFNILVEQYPDGTSTPRGYYAMGDALFNLGKYDAAIASYKTVADRFTSSPLAPDAVNAMQYCLTLLGRDQEAATLADAYITNNPNSQFSQEIRFKKAELLFNSRKFENAVAEYEDFLNKDRNADKTPEKHAEALLMMGKSYLGLNDTSRAFATFARLQERFPKSPSAAAAALEVGLFRMEQKRFVEADTLFARLTRQHPNDESGIRAAFERANLRETRGDTAQAIVLYKGVAERYAGTDYGDRCRFRVATWFRSRNEFDSARAQFALLFNRTDELGAEAQYRTGELYQREKNYPKAIEAYLNTKTKFTDIEDWYSLALVNLGLCYEQVRNLEAAKEAYKLVIVARSGDDIGKAAQQHLDRLMKM
jgi:TolA-binding protein